MTWWKYILLTVLTSLPLLLNSFAHAFPSPEERKLVLRGEATYRYWGFKVYSAKLYTSQTTSDIRTTLGQIPLRFELTYARDLTADDFIKSGEAFMRDNPEISFESLSPSLMQMNALYQDVKEGDTYSIDFEPGKGISLYLNGTLKGTVPGDEFAKGYLGIWLSKYSLSESFTEAITGNA